MQDYRQEIEAARSIALPAIRSFVENQLSRKYGASWANNLRSRLKSSPTPISRGYLDLYQCLRVIDVFWSDIFARQFSSDPKAIQSLVHEAIAIRNAHAHDRKFSLDDAERALDTFTRLCRAIRAETHAKQITDRRRILLQKSLNNTANQTQATEKTNSPQAPQSAPRQFYQNPQIADKPKSKERQTITKENTLDCYQLGRKVYANQITRADAAEMMVEKGMNQASAFFLVSAAEEMLQGKTYKRALSLMSTRTFLEQIEKDYGKDGLATALKALDGHIDFKLENTTDRCVSQKKISAEFKKRLV